MLQYLLCCLDRRVKDIHFLKKELEQKLEEIILETESLITLHGRVQKALEACKDPLKVIVQCLDERYSFKIIMKTGPSQIKTFRRIRPSQDPKKTYQGAVLLFKPYKSSVRQRLVAHGKVIISTGSG